MGFDQADAHAVACEAVRETEQPLSRQSVNDVTQRVQQRVGKTISRSTVWRWLHEAAIKPWQYEYWVYPRAPDFAGKAAPILDLDQGFWEGQPLGEGDFVISADEKTSIQARIRTHSGQPPGPGRSARIEHEYQRGGALQSLAVWDVHRGWVCARTEPQTGIQPFMSLAEQAMSQEPYRSADRVFWIVDDGSSHRGQSAIDRLNAAWSHAQLIHTPVHASWLNQIEIDFSLLQRQVLTPNDFLDLQEVRSRLAEYEQRINEIASPFNWTWTRADLNRFMKKVAPHLAA